MSDQYLKKLLGKFLDDVEKGIDPMEAGWIEGSFSEHKSLIERGICEGKDAKVRIAFRPLDKDIYDQLDEDDKWLAEIHEEIINAKNILNEVLQAINDPSLQPAIVFLGWERMLRTSTFPVLIDRILAAKLSIDEWLPKALLSSGGLSLKVVQKWWSDDEIINGLNKLGHKANFVVEPKVMEILKWDEVIIYFDKNLTTVLGVLWFADSKITGLIYPESIVYFQKEIWKTVENMVGKESEEIRDNLISTIKIINSKTGETDRKGKSCPIAHWNLIIRAPW